MIGRTPRPASTIRDSSPGDAFQRDPKTGWTTLRVRLTTQDYDGILALIDEANMTPPDYVKAMIRREIVLACRGSSVRSL